MQVSERFSSSSFRGVDFEGSTVGLANTNAMCTSNSGAVNEVNVLFLFNKCKVSVFLKGKQFFYSTSLFSRTTTITRLEWPQLLHMRWVTTWACPMTLKTVSVAP